MSLKDLIKQTNILIHKTITSYFLINHRNNGNIIPKRAFLLLQLHKMHPGRFFILQILLGKVKTTEFT